MKEFSEETLHNLAILYKDEQSAYETFKKAAKHQGGKHMKTGTETFQKLGASKEQLERELANLHRLTFLKAYYELQGNHHEINQLVQQQQNWKLSSLTNTGK